MSLLTIIVIVNDKTNFNLVTHLLNQTLRDIEIIIITSKKLNIYNNKIKIYEIKNKSKYYKINYAINKSNSKYITIYHVNDILKNYRFKRHIQYMEENNYLISLCLAKYQNNNILALNSLIINKQLFTDIGYFVETDTGSNINFILKYMKKYEKKYDWKFYFKYQKNIGLFRNYNQYGFLSIDLFEQIDYYYDNKYIILINNLIKKYNKQIIKNNPFIKDTEIKKLKDIIKYKNKIINDKDNTINDKNKIIKDKDKIIKDKDKIIKKLQNRKLKSEHTIFKSFYGDQIYISKSLNHLDRICKIYNLKLYNNIHNSSLFFGIYHNEDIEKLKNHKGNKFIIWGGTDCDINSEKRMKKINKVKKIPNIIHYSISDDIENRLNKINLKSIRIDLNIVDNVKFNKVVNYGNKIYIYNGLTIGQEEKYNKKIYEIITNKLQEYEYIYSNNLNLKNSEISKIYKQCFIGLRLTENDGNANTVQEFKSMNIPIIHNLSCYGIKWKNVDDIILNIKYRNIDAFNNSIKKFNSLLFICSDYPGYGGAATNCYKLIKYYKSIGKNVKGIFYTDELCKFTFEDYIEIIKTNQLKSKIQTLDFKPDILILRNYLRIPILKIIKYPIYFLIPGIFLPTLDKNYLDIKSKSEMDNYIHANILITARNSTKVFIASKNSKDIIEKYYDIKSEILPFNYIPYYNNFDIFLNKNRKYKYGIIVSDFNRKVKNITFLINKLILMNETVILIGKNSNLYDQFFTCLDLIHPNEIINYYKDIEYILHNSHYESCSNVLIEAKFNGCKIISQI